jgi:hypothetical protein
MKTLEQIKDKIEALEADIKRFPKKNNPLWQEC